MTQNDDLTYTWDQFVEIVERIPLDDLTADSSNQCLMAAVGRELTGQPFATVGYSNGWAGESLSSHGQSFEADNADRAKITNLIRDWVEVASSHFTRGEVDGIEDVTIYLPVPVEETLAVLRKHIVEREG